MWALVFGASFGSSWNIEHWSISIKVLIQSPTQVDSIKCQRIIYILLLESYQPHKGVQIPHYKLDNLVLFFLAQRFAKLILLSPDLSFQHLSCRIRSPLLGHLCTGNPFSLLRLASDRAYSTLRVQAIHIAILCRLLVGLDGNYHSLEGRKLHLYMTRWGHCSYPIQDRPAQKNVIS